MDPAVVAPMPGGIQIKLKWASLATYEFAHLDPAGVSGGTLDPLIAVAAISQNGVGYPDVLFITVWRKLAIVNGIIGLLVPLPMALGFLAAAVGNLMASAVGFGAVMFVFALLFGLAAFTLVRRGFIIGKRLVRVVGRYGVVEAQFQTSPAFYTELFRRCGLVAPPLP